MKKDTLAQTLIKGLDVLECVAASKTPLSAMEVSKRTGISRPTAYRLLISLEIKGYVARESTSLFRMGSSILKLSKNELDKFELTEIAKPALIKLCEKTGETSILSILSGIDIINLARIESSKTIRIESKVGSISPAYCTATGKAILAFLEKQKRDELISRIDFIPRTKKTARNAQELAARLDTIHLQGYSIDDHEYDDEMMCISAPIFDITGKVVAAIGFSGVAFRVEKLDQNEIIQSVLEAANDVSRRIGYKK